MFRHSLTSSLIKTLQNSLAPDPDLVSKTLNFLENSCSSISDLKRVQSFLVVSGNSDNPFLNSRLVKFCSASPSGSLNYAIFLHSKLSSTNPFPLNTILKSFIKKSQPSNAISFFKSSSTPPNHYTFPLLVIAAASLENIHQGEIFHAHALKLGFLSVVPVLNSLIHMYANCDGLDSARQVFNEISGPDLVSYTSLIDGYVKAGYLDIAFELFWVMPNRNVISWNALLSGYVQNGRLWKGLWLFRQMVDLRFEPDDGTFVSVLYACSNMKKVLYGKSVHGVLIRKWREVPIHVGTALVNFYSNCGLLRKAVLVFARMSDRDLICWNALISGVATQGKGEDAISIFERMLNEGIRPDDITFVGILTACAHSSLVEEGLRHFEMMKTDFGIKPRFSHYLILVELFIRVDDIDNAMKLIIEMPLDNQSSIWGALIAVAKICGDIEVGEYLGKRLIELEPHNSSRYLPLMNIYAVAQRWDKCNELQDLMKERGLKRVAESTLINLNIIAHNFSMGDKSQPEIKMIYSVLEEMAKKLNLRAPSTDEVSSAPIEA